MIARSALSLALVWLSLPHHPDLGLAPPSRMVADSTRQTILQRLHQVRGELRASHGQAGLRTAMQISPTAWPSAPR